MTIGGNMYSPDVLFTTQGINIYSTREQVKAAYKTLAKKYHPDVTRDNGEQMKKITEYYTYLINRPITIPTAVPPQDSNNVRNTNVYNNYNTYNNNTNINFDPFEIIDKAKDRFVSQLDRQKGELFFWLTFMVVGSIIAIIWAAHS
jgi:hypothetical protein